MKFIYYGVFLIPPHSNEAKEVESVNMKAIFTLMNTTQPVLKIRP